MIKAVIFDLDNTLYDYDACDRYAKKALEHFCTQAVVLVDNGSKDHTDGVLADLLPEYSFARSIRIEANQGYGHGIVQGLKSCRGKFIGWTHADMQTDPADLIKALKIIEKYGDREDLFIKGSRTGRPLFSK